MNEENKPTQPDNQEVTTPEPTQEVPPLTKTDAIAGVFTEPGDTFSTIAKSPKHNYWLLPVIIFIIVNLISTFLFLSDDELVSKVMDKQFRKVEQKMEENVKDGTMTQQEADIALEQTEKFMSPGSVFFLISAYGAGLVMPFVLLFALSLVYLIALKILKAEFVYVNMLNVIGLSFVILAIGKILDVVLSILTGDINTISAGLFFNEASVGESLYKLLMAVDAFVIWFLIIIAIGLSKISGIKSNVSYTLAFGVWIIWILITSFIF
ncbi:MAG: YIP1 family protein [Bacteroidetes bacterium]|nr:YIP1 family protein [Bacteroidota bacterium]